MSKFILQATFDSQNQNLIAHTANYCARYSDRDNEFFNRRFVESMLFDFDGDKLMVKRAQTRQAEIAEDVAILTLDYFLPGLSVFVDTDKFENKNVTQLYALFITEDLPADRELHILIYMNLNKTDDIQKINKLLSSFPANLTVTLDIALLPIDSTTNDKSTLRQNLLKLVDLKRNHTSLSNIFFWETIDEHGISHTLEENNLVETFGRLVLSMINGYNYIRNNNNDYPITLFGMKSLQIDKYGIIDNWYQYFLRDVIRPFSQNVGDKHIIDKDKVHGIIGKILHKEKSLITNAENKGSTADGIAADYKSAILDIIIHGDLHPKDLEYLLDCCRSLSNRNSNQADLLGTNGVPIPDELFADMLGNLTGDDSFVKLRELIHKIQLLKKNIHSQEQLIEEKKKYLTEYSYDGELSDKGFLIHGQEFHTYSFKETPLESNYESHSSNLPPSADLRKYFTTIKNQGKQGACASFSLVSVFEYFMANETASNPNLSEAFVYYNARENTGDNDKDSGATLQNVIKAMSDRGICVENLCPYNEKVYDKRPEDEAYADGQKRKVVKAQNVELKLDTVKAAINEGFPVVASFRVFDSFAKNVGGFVSMPSPKEQESEKMEYHAMVICGYSDEHGYFIVRNSWGKKFGDKGYCYIPYAYVRDPKLTTYACAITGIDINTAKHKAEQFVYNQDEQSGNIQYSILQNQLIEDQHCLNNDYILLDELSKQYTTILHSVVNGQCLDRIKEQHDKDVSSREEAIKQLWNDYSRYNINSQKKLNIVHGSLSVISIALIIFGICSNFNRSYIVSGGVAMLISIIVYLIRLTNSKKKTTAIKSRIVSLEKEITQLNENYNKKASLQKVIASLICEVNVITNNSEQRKVLLKKIEEFLSKTHSLLTNNPHADIDPLSFLDEYKNIVANSMNGLKLLPFFFGDDNTPHNILETFREFQKKIFSNFRNAFNPQIETIFGPNTDEWRQFGLQVSNLPLQAQVTLTQTEPGVSIFFSNNEHQFPNCFLVNSNNNQYLYLHLKRVDPENNLHLFINK